MQGVLIVGEIGTGKTSLALAIAAEARVPVVQVKPQQLEAGLWVGQGASNVRELFQTARELVDLNSPYFQFFLSQEEYNLLSSHPLICFSLSFFVMRKILFLLKVP